MHLGMMALVTDVDGSHDRILAPLFCIEQVWCTRQIQIERTFRGERFNAMVFPGGDRPAVAPKSHIFIRAAMERDEIHCGRTSPHSSSADLKTFQLPFFDSGGVVAGSLEMNN